MTQLAILHRVKGVRALNGTIHEVMGSLGGGSWHTHRTVHHLSELRGSDYITQPYVTTKRNRDSSWAITLLEEYVT